ncbi:MAG: hypothetical protein EB127_02555 [Alphaproteobacteria bacterium]|nr:hypothetical protein [Alphaproteobacteria bacterium]
MKYFLYGFLLTSVLLSGCANMLPPSKDQLYYEAAKSISKDNTISQTACWNAITEIAKGGDSGAKVGAVITAEKCKNEIIKIDRPRNWFGL